MGDQEWDRDRLERVNIALNTAENNGSRLFFCRLLDPVFAMRKATGDLVDRDHFIGKLVGGGSARSWTEAPGSSSSATAEQS